MGPVGGVVDVQHDLPGHGAEAVAEQIDHPQPHPRQRPPAGQIFQPRQRRLRDQPQRRIRHPLTRHLHRRVVAQRIHVITVFVPAGDRHAPRPDHRGVGVPGPRRIAMIRETGCKHIRDPHLALDLAQEQHTTVRGQRTAIETGMDIETVDW